MRLQRRTYLVVVSMLLVVAIFFTVAGVALAQVSEQYDMACWGIQTGGGGARSSSQHNVIDAFGQTWGVASSSTAYTLRPGYIQTRPGAQPPPPAYANEAYLPLVSAATALGICSW